MLLIKILHLVLSNLWTIYIIRKNNVLITTPQILSRPHHVDISSDTVYLTILPYKTIFYSVLIGIGVLN